MAGQGHTRKTALAATLAAACALALGACGDDGDDPVASGTPDDGATGTTAVDAGDGGDEGDGDGASPCDALTEDAVAGIVGEVTDSGDYGGTPQFGRPDGTSFDYTSNGCTFDVAVEGDEDPHEYTVSAGTPVDAGIDLFEEFRSSRDAEDIRPVDDLGDDAFVDTTFGDRKVQLIVRTGDTVLFVDSSPPFGVPVADDEVLVALAELALGDA